MVTFSYMVDERQKATLAAGCFWGIEASFQKLNGVLSTKVGYTGGELKNPTYEDVCTGKTGHAEAIEIEFDPKAISFEKLLEAFWKIHDPTTLNRQGPDIGTQYRSAVFFHSTNQESTAKEMVKKYNESKIFKNPIVTEIKPASVFYDAEEYHQNYYKKLSLKRS